MENSEEAMNPKARAYTIPQPRINLFPYHNQVIVAPEKIREYLRWSIVNTVLGFLLFGMIAIVLSLLVRRRAREGDFTKAKKLSTITLLWNTFVSLVGTAIWAYIIYSIVASAIGTSRAVKKGSG
ncbi:unnamed protein product [Rotaria magnacalcarata]|uniref:Interferon-induced transmembrane protein n=1 Tax=Rotaria magnacalcarata TaxID=392030 RepID=A0A816PC80_9BILA|nr:unnamed protein product [Rotaria magnacalcarata]CAF4714867.1 unnamed protein product [Rotaria magnacalcarata]